MTVSVVKRKAVLDTSALIYLLENRQDPVDVVRSLEGVRDIYVPSYVVDELKRLATGASGRRRRLARVALKYVINASRSNLVKIVEMGEGSVDDLLLRDAEEKGLVIVTADMGLRRRAVEKGLEVFSPEASRRGRRLV